MGGEHGVCGCDIVFRRERMSCCNEGGKGHETWGIRYSIIGEWGKW